MASTKLTKSQSGTSTNEYKGTYSWWMKRSNVSSTQYLISIESGQERFFWYILSSGAFSGNYRASGGSPDVDLALTGSPKFIDPNAWYHCVLAWDTSQGTQLNRIRFYVNNVEYVVTQSQTINQNTVFPPNKSSFGGALELFASGSQNYFDGIISHFYYVDGQQLTPSTFGETDSTTGEWKIKTNPTVTIGTQGYIILKDGNTITDQSANSNNFTLASGTLTKTEDNPSNVFATMNPFSCSSYGSLTNGNTSVAGNNNADVAQFFSTLSTGKTGKYYIETKVTGYTGTRPGFGIGNDDNPNIGKNVSGGTQMTGENNFTSPSFNYRLDGAIRVNGSTTATYSTFTIGDIISIAVDMDNGASYVAKNGTWQNSGNPASGASKTGAITTWTAGSISGFLINADIYYGASGDGNHADADFNFGNGYFGTTAVSSAGTNASNNGIFEYNVPAGYTALSTKGLNL